MAVTKNLMAGIMNSGDGTALAEKPAEAKPASQLAIPSFVSSLPKLPDVSELPGQTGIYVQFAHPMSPSWPKQTAARAAEGDPLLCVEGNMLLLNPFRFFVLSVAGFRTKIDESGTVLAASENLSDKQKNGHKLDEHYSALILVIHEGQLIPAKCDFRATKADPGSTAVRTMHQASSPDWAKMGPAYAVSASFPEPWGRFVLDVTKQPYVSKTTGRKSQLAKASVSPVTQEQIDLLVKSLADEQFISALNEVADSFKQRVSALQKACL